jgi:hypothetical protein
LTGIYGTTEVVPFHGGSKLARSATKLIRAAADKL